MKNYFVALFYASCCFQTAFAQSVVASTQVAGTRIVIDKSFPNDKTLTVFGFKTNAFAKHTFFENESFAFNGAIGFSFLYAGNSQQKMQLSYFGIPLKVELKKQTTSTSLVKFGVAYEHSLSGFIDKADDGLNVSANVLDLRSLGAEIGVGWKLSEDDVLGGFVGIEQGSFSNNRGGAHSKTQFFSSQLGLSYDHSF